MNFATVLRLVDMKRGDGWDFRYTTPYFWKLMADKLGVGLFAVMSDENFEKICNQCDGLIVPGSSNDINPSYWGGEPFKEQFCDEYPLDAKLIRYFMEKGKPIIGICGGLQSINVCLGGSLKNVAGHNEDKKYHNINIDKDSFLYDAFKSEKASVNTYHSWAIDKVAPNLRVVATSDDGVIEAVEWKEKRIFAMQWHPERSFEEKESLEHKIFENFINICKG